MLKYVKGKGGHQFKKGGKFQQTNWNCKKNKNKF